MRLKSIRTIRIAVDADYWQNDYGRRLGVGVDIFAARAHLVGKPDDLAHCSPPLSPRANDPHEAAGLAHLCD